MATLTTTLGAFHCHRDGELSASASSLGCAFGGPGTVVIAGFTAQDGSWTPEARYERVASRSVTHVWRFRCAAKRGGARDLVIHA